MKQKPESQEHVDVFYMYENAQHIVALATSYGEKGGIYWSDSPFYVMEEGHPLLPTILGLAALVGPDPDELEGGVSETFPLTLEMASQLATTCEEYGRSTAFEHNACNICVVNNYKFPPFFEE